jgi:hypothetical protein
MRVEGKIIYKTINNRDIPVPIFFEGDEETGMIFQRQPHSFIYTLKISVMSGNFCKIEHIVRDLLFRSYFDKTIEVKIIEELGIKYDVITYPNKKIGGLKFNLNNTLQFKFGEVKIIIYDLQRLVIILDSSINESQNILTFENLNI